MLILQPATKETEKRADQRERNTEHDDQREDGRLKLYGHDHKDEQNAGEGRHQQRGKLFNLGFHIGGLGQLDSGRELKGRHLRVDIGYDGARGVGGNLSGDGDKIAVIFAGDALRAVGIFDGSDVEQRNLQTGRVGHGEGREVVDGLEPLGRIFHGDVVVAPAGVEGCGVIALHDGVKVSHDLRRNKTVGTRLDRVDDDLCLRVAGRDAGGDVREIGIFAQESLDHQRGFVQLVAAGRLQVDFDVRAAAHRGGLARGRDGNIAVNNIFGALAPFVDDLRRGADPVVLEVGR